MCSFVGGGSGPGICGRLPQESRLPRYYFFFRREINKKMFFLI
jgi:hypothetical protein